MIDETQKLRKFKDAVYAEAEKKADKIIRKAKADKKAKVKKAAKASNQYTEAAMARVDREEQQRFTKEVSAQRLDAQKQVLLYREALVNKVFENVRARLDEYRKSDKYASWLLKTVGEAKKLYPDEVGKIQISQTDMQYADSLKNATGYEVECVNTILLGGIMVSFEEINVVLDSTFDGEIENQRENFCLTAQLAVEQD